MNIAMQHGFLRIRSWSNLIPDTPHQYYSPRRLPCQPNSASTRSCRRIEGGVNLIGCQMPVDLFGFTPGDFIPEVKEYCGAATFLPKARDADVSLFI
jgi:predicted peroxiredoxin